MKKALLKGRWYFSYNVALVHSSYLNVFKYFTTAQKFIWRVYSYFENGCRKKAQKCTRQDRKVVWVEVESYCTRWILMRCNDATMRICTFSFTSDMWKQGTCSHVNFRRIFKTQIHATVEVKLQKKASWEEKQIFTFKNTNLYISLGQYAKF